MANQALGMIETKGLTALIEASDAMLKAARSEAAGQANTQKRDRKLAARNDPRPLVPAPAPATAC